MSMMFRIAFDRFVCVCVWVFHRNWQNFYPETSPIDRYIFNYLSMSSFPHDKHNIVHLYSVVAPVIFRLGYHPPCAWGVQRKVEVPPKIPKSPRKNCLEYVTKTRRRSRKLLAEGGWKSISEGAYLPWSSSTGLSLHSIIWEGRKT